MRISDKNEMEFNKSLTVGGERITERYTVIYMEGKYEFYDNSLSEVVFSDSKHNMEVFIKGFTCGRTTQG